MSTNAVQMLPPRMAKQFADRADKGEGYRHPTDPSRAVLEEALAIIEAMGTVEMSVPVLDEAGNRDEKETTVRLSPEAKIARAALKSIQEARSATEEK